MTELNQMHEKAMESNAELQKEIDASRELRLVEEAKEKQEEKETRKKKIETQNKKFKKRKKRKV